MLDQNCQCHSTDLKFELLGRCDDNINIGTDTISIEFFANAIAKFEDDSILQMHHGILMTSGKAKNALGPNDNMGKSFSDFVNEYRVVISF